MRALTICFRASAVLQLVWLLLLDPLSAQAQERWTVGLGGGVADRYTWHTFSLLGNDYHERFDFTWHGSVGVGYNLDQHLSLQADASYLQYQEERGLIGIPELPPPSYKLSATFPSLGVGLRLYPAGPNTSRPRAYVQIEPTLYFTRWEERIESGGTVADQTFTELQPGFAAGLGLVGLNQTPVRLDIGFRYYYTPDLGSRLSLTSAELQGLRQFALIVGVHKPL